MNTEFKITVSKIEHEDGFSVFTILLENENQQKNYKIYDFDKDSSIRKLQPTRNELNDLAKKQMNKWIADSNNEFPKNKYLVLISGGRVPTDKISGFLSVKKRVDNLTRTNVTIAAPLFEWAKAKAKNDGTSFSDLVSRGLLTLKDSDKEVNAWYKTQRAYFKKQLGDLGSFEIFHYLPNNEKEFDVNQLKNALQQAEIRRTGWPIGVYLTGGNQKPQPQLDGIKAEYNPSDFLKIDYWYAKNRGEFYFARNLESDTGNGDARPKTTLYFDTLIWRIAESFEHCLVYYEKLNVDANKRIKIKLSLDGLRNRSLGAWNQMRAITLSHYTCDSERSIWETEIKLNLLEKQLDELIYDATKKLLIMFDFFVPNKGVVMDILNREYRKSNM